MAHEWDPQQFKAGANSAGVSAKSVEAALATAAAIKSVHPELPVVFTLGHLAHLADVSPARLERIVRREVDPYKVFRVKKRGTPAAGNAAPRRYRTICVPEPGLMRVQRWIAQNILNAIPPHPSSFAFAPGGKMRDAAARHSNAAWLVKVDVRHFFESITERQAYRVFRSFAYPALLSFELARLCTRLAPRLTDLTGAPPKDAGPRSSSGLPYPSRLQGTLPQGAPTSPMLANHAVRSLDIALSALASAGGWRYTRYADDMHFSRSMGGDRHAAVSLSHEVERALSQVGLKANRQKTTVTPPGARKIVLGLLVDSARPRLSRSFRNNIETHVYALTHPKVGVQAHQARRGFVSAIGMRRHIEGLIAYAGQIDPGYGDALKRRLNAVVW